MTPDNESYTSCLASWFQHKENEIGVQGKWELLVLEVVFARRLSGRVVFARRLSDRVSFIHLSELYTLTMISYMIRSEFL